MLSADLLKKYGPVIDSIERKRTSSIGTPTSNAGPWPYKG
jgi:hypothetical protein